MTICIALCRTLQDCTLLENTLPWPKGETQAYCVFDARCFFRELQQLGHGGSCHGLRHGHGTTDAVHVTGLSAVVGSWNVSSFVQLVCCSIIIMLPSRSCLER
jgi:hypothetical protein